MLFEGFEYRKRGRKKGAVIFKVHQIPNDRIVDTISCQFALPPVSSVFSFRFQKDETIVAFFSHIISSPHIH
jgi:hypothetical protein